MLSINFNLKMRLSVVINLSWELFLLINVFVYIGALWVLPQHEAQYLLGLR